MIGRYFFIFAFLFFLFLYGCVSLDYESIEYNYEFDNPTVVIIEGYDGDAMESFISRDGRYLFFNNLNSSEVKTNLYYAEYLNDSTFIFRGEIDGVNSEYLDTVPTMDTLNVFYFISTRSYDSTECTIYCGLFDSGKVLDVHLINGFKPDDPLIVNFDAEISCDGKTLYTVNSRFSVLGSPQTCDIIILEKDDNGNFYKIDNSDEITRYINTDGFEYAACISMDQLELFFTHWNKKDNPQIYVAKRSSVNEPFGYPQKIIAVDGFVEGPTLSSDGTKLYYHKKVGDRFVIYYVKRELK